MITEGAHSFAQRLLNLALSVFKEEGSAHVSEMNAAGKAVLDWHHGVAYEDASAWVNEWLHATACEVLGWRKGSTHPQRFSECQVANLPLVCLSVDGVFDRMFIKLWHQESSCGGGTGFTYHMKRAG